MFAFGHIARSIASCATPLTLLLLAHVCAAADRATPSPEMTYIYDGPESDLDNRYSYPWAVLRAALEKTVPKYGPYKMSPSTPMTEKRQVLSLQHNTGALSVMYRGIAPDLESTLVPIRIPIDKDLQGYCVFLMNKKDAPKLAAARTADTLKKFSVSLGYGWIDVDILRHNGFDVRTGTSYEGLFRMLEQGRFDLFLRSSVEVLDELESRKAAFPGMTIMQNVALYYPMPMYFWFADTADGKKLAARAEAGLWMMVNDGSFDAVFEKYQRHKIDQLGLKNRKIIAIKNPYFAGPAPPYDDPRLWFKP